MDIITVTALFVLCDTAVDLACSFNWKRLLTKKTIAALVAGYIYNKVS